MRNRRVKSGIAAIITVIFLICITGLILYAQKGYVPENTVSALDTSRSQVYVTGIGYKIDNGQKKFNHKIEKEKKEERKSDANEISQNGVKGDNAQGSSGKIDIGDNGNSKGNNDNPSEDDTQPGTEKDLRPTITTNLYDGETVQGTYTSFYVVSRDHNGRHLTADMMAVTCNGTVITSTGDDGSKIAYRADLQDGTNEFTLTATDKYGMSRTITRTIKCNYNGTAKKIGYVWMTVDAKTVGLGKIIPRQKVDLYKGDQLSYVFDRFIKSNSGFSYGHNGSLESGFYLANIRKTGITAGAKIPDKLKKYLDDAGWTQKDYHDNLLGDEDFTQHSGWLVSINGAYPSRGMSAVTLDDGDEIVLEFTLWNGADINGTWNWEN